MTHHHKKTPDVLVIDLKKSEQRIEPPQQAALEKKVPSPIVRHERKTRVYTIGAILSTASVAMIIGVAIGAGGSWITYEKSTPISLTASSTAPVVEKKSSETIVERVGKLLLLPADESPTIAAVSDISKLQDQLFFKNAKNGDVVLMFAKAQRAVLFDPELNKIIEVAPLTVDAKK